MARPVSDPLSWIGAHVNTIRLCSKLMDGLKADDHGKSLERLLSGLPQAVPLTLSPSAIIAKEDRRCSKFWTLGEELHGNDSPFYALAHVMVKDIINSNIRGIHVRLTDNQSGDRRDYRLMWSFTALIQVPYFELARRRENHGHRVRCQAQGCGRSFFQTDARQKFCPPDDIAGESKCAVRQRARDRRERLVNRSKRKGGNHGQKGR
jgi:hypothetical protein